MARNAVVKVTTWQKEHNKSSQCILSSGRKPLQYDVSCSSFAWGNASTLLNAHSVGSFLFLFQRVLLVSVFGFSYCCRPASPFTSSRVFVLFCLFVRLFVIIIRSSCSSSSASFTVYSSISAIVLLLVFLFLALVLVLLLLLLFKFFFFFLCPVIFFFYFDLLLRLVLSISGCLLFVAVFLLRLLLLLRSS